MSDKYYQPSIEEFHVGFEYEYKASPRIDENDGYIKTVFKKTDLIAAIIHRLEEYPIIRVKYLDSEDIESLGFDEEVGIYPTFTMESELYSGPTTITINADGTNLLIKSSPHDLFEANGHRAATPIFTGKVKNKSELVRLLKQLNITK